MAEARPSTGSDTPALDLAEPSEEGISGYIHRGIAADAAFKKLASQARHLGVEVTLPSLCRPAFLTTESVGSYYRAFAQLNQDPSADGFERLIDHLWVGRHPNILPLDLRLAKLADPAVCEVPWAGGGITRSWTDTLRVVRKAAHRRDSFIAAVFDALRSGEWVASGFIPGDHLRQAVPIVAAWWADDQMQCNWRDGELRQWEAATPGRPTFLGVTLSAATVCNGVARQQETPAEITSSTKPPVVSQPFKPDWVSWYKNRVDAWPSGCKPPSEREDLAAAKAHSSHANRDMVRKLRFTHAPDAWKRAGPKPKST